MKLLISTFILCFSLSSEAKVYNCSLDGENGAIDLSYSQGKKAQVVLSFNGKSHTYKNCKANRDDFGLLFDCSNGQLDFVVLINDELSPATGGIMSTTHDLFVDLEC